ncbi:Complement C1q-like protein 2 [Anabarilius grahami]|uniref:Complement C1q-like protein 2 n=1 Tax=Anabarilius grahami TaxID=495550 RepID=A0A3N0XY49_ANAGA|nr:Complement C1q-like protein 2 [Anabarilius grahami]
MRLTIAVLLLLYKCLIFAPIAADLTNTSEPVTSELCTKDENKQLTCPLKICTDLLKKLGATENQLKALEIRLANSEAQIKELKKVTQDRPKVAFSASLGSNGFIGPVDADSTLVYKNVFVNLGGAYNRNTGIFTATVRGIYYFSFFYHCGVDHGTALDLYKNGKIEAATGHQKSSGSPENGGNGLMLVLEKGDQVYMRPVVSASNLRAFRFTLFRRPVGFALAPRPLSSTWDHRPYRSTGYPRPASSTSVSRCSAITTDFQVFGCTSSLHHYALGSSFPSGSVSVLFRTVASIRVVGRGAAKDLEVRGDGRVMAGRGGAGGTREPIGAVRTTVPGGAEGARSQGEANWSMDQGEAKSSEDRGKDHRSTLQVGAGN